MSIKERIHDDLTKDEIINAQELEIEQLQAENEELKMMHDHYLNKCYELWDSYWQSRYSHNIDLAMNEKASHKALEEWITKPKNNE